MRYLLFDIDGTMTVGGSGEGAGAKALNRAFAELFGIDKAFDGVQKAGKTDPIIMREGFELNGVPFIPDSAMKLMRLYLEYLETYLKDPALRSTILPGVEALLTVLADMPDMELGVLTGNWRRGASLKLGSVGLEKYFDGLGAYGEDAATRPELMTVAWKRYYARHREDISAADTIIIGDTPGDVECALSNSARVLAVTTGPFSEEELIAAKATRVMPGLTDIDAVVAFLSE
jgi:phosphoglycolate phosphatase